MQHVLSNSSTLQNASLAIRSPNLDYYEGKGRKLYESLTKAINDHADNSGSFTVDDANWTMDRNPNPVLSVDGFVEYMLHFISFSPSNYGSFQEIEMTNIGVSSGVYYDNLYSVPAGIIVAKINIGKFDENHIAQLHWSDVVFPIWNSECARAGQKASNLQYIIRHMVVNRETAKILNTLIPEPYAGESYSFTPMDNNFFMVLGSPNGIGIAYLCIRYARAMGYKTITKITLFYNDLALSWNILLELGTAEAMNTPAHTTHPS